MSSHGLARRSVAPLLIGTCILRMNSGASTVVLGLLLANIASFSASAHAITSLQVGLLPVAFYVTELTLAPALGALTDRWGRRNFLIIGPFFGLIHAALLFFTPFVNPLPYLLALEVLAGVSGAMMTPAALGYLADYTVQNPARRMRVMSFYELATSAGLGLGIVVGSLAWERFGRFTFVLLACSYILIALCMLLSPVVNQVAEHGKLRATARRYMRILRMPRLLVFIPAWLCISALLGIWLSSQLTFLLTSRHSDPQQLLMGSLHGPGKGLWLGLVLGGVVLCFGAGLLFWAFFLTRLPRLRLMLTSILGVYLACLALYGLNHRGIGNEQMLFIWLPCLLLGIFAETSFAPAALAYLADISEAAAQDRGLVMGLYSVFLGLGQIIGNGLGGVFATQLGFDGLIYLTALLAFIALCALLWLFRQEQAFSKRDKLAQG